MILPPAKNCGPRFFFVNLLCVLVDREVVCRLSTRFAPLVRRPEKAELAASMAQRPSIAANPNLPLAPPSPEHSKTPTPTSDKARSASRGKHARSASFGDAPDGRGPGRAIAAGQVCMLASLQLAAVVLSLEVTPVSPRRCLTITKISGLFADKGTTSAKAMLDGWKGLDSGGDDGGGGVSGVGAGGGGVGFGGGKSAIGAAALAGPGRL